MFGACNNVGLVTEQVCTCIYWEYIGAVLKRIGEYGVAMKRTMGVCGQELVVKKNFYTSCVHSNPLLTCDQTIDMSCVHSNPLLTCDQQPSIDFTKWISV